MVAAAAGVCDGRLLTPSFASLGTELAGLLPNVLLGRALPVYWPCGAFGLAETAPGGTTRGALESFFRRSSSGLRLAGTELVLLRVGAASLLALPPLICASRSLILRVVL